MIPWTIRIATLLYVIALAQMIRRRPARAAWTAGCLFYLAHAIAGFHYVYQWSHETAVRETARITEELFGINWGGGIWFNYVFTAIWAADALWWHMAPESRKRRPAWVNNGVHIYMAWMFINGAIVFPRGPTRWIAVVLAVGLVVAWRRSRHDHPISTPQRIL